MKKLIFVTIFMMATGQTFSQSAWKIAPYLQQTGLHFASDRVSSLGYGSGLGLSLTKSHFIVQTDMNLYWMNGNALSNRLAAGFRKDGLWSPTVLGTFSLIWGSRTEILNESGQRPPSATWAAGLRVAPFRFENDKGYLSVAEIGYGKGPDNGKSLEISLVTIGINF